MAVQKPLEITHLECVTVCERPFVVFLVLTFLYVTVEKKNFCCTCLIVILQFRKHQFRLVTSVVVCPIFSGMRREKDSSTLKVT